MAYHILKETTGGGEVELQGWGFEGVAPLVRNFQDFKSFVSSRSQLELRKSNPFEGAVQVELVADNLLSFLHLEDMKALGEVSWTMLKAIRNSSKFHSLARLHLSKEVLQSGINNLTLDGNYFWKNISLDLCPNILTNPELRYFLGKILEPVHSLKLHIGGGSLETCEIFHHLGDVLKMSKRLKALGLEVGILNSKACPCFFTSRKIKRVLRGILDLTIHGKRGVPSQAYYSVNSQGSKWGPTTLFHENIVKLSAVVSQLKKFTFLQRLPYCFAKASELDKCIPVLMDANKSSLEVIEIRQDDVWDGMRDIHFPNLKSVKMSSDGEVKGSVAQFLLHQHLLEELDIFLTEYCSLAGILKGLLRAGGKLDKLKRLHLGTNRYALADEHSLPRNWKFLREMTALTDFSLSVPLINSRSWVGIGEDILRSLPITTEKISIHNLRHFWRKQGNAGVVPSRFGNLKKLDLLECNNALNDFGLLSLIVDCPKLGVLSFSECGNVTDYGLTGIQIWKDRTVERSGVSLDQLKGLTQLTIRDCPGISRKGLLSVMNFEQLKTFDYRGADKELSLKKQFFLGLLCRYPDYPQRDRKFLFQIARQNPSLDRLAISPVVFDYEYDPHLVKSLIREISPRIRDLDLKRNWK